MNSERIWEEIIALVNLRAVDIVYLDFSEAIDTASRKMLTEKLKYELNEQPVRGIENWVNSWAQRVVISGTKSSWRPVASDAPQGSILDPVASPDVFMYLPWSTGITLPNSAQDTVSLFCWRGTLLAHVEPGGEQPPVPINAGGHPAGMQLGRKRAGGLVDSKLNMSQQYVLAAKKG